MSIRYATTCAECGWTGDYTSQAKADYAFRRHSCDKQQRRAESAARRIAAEAAVDRNPKPCLHKVADHQHGTRACYVLDRCRCWPCAKANSAASSWRERQKAYGRYDKYVDAGPVREHVRRLMAYGIGLKQITRLTGINGGQLTKIMYGSSTRLDKTPTARVLRSTAERLAAVAPVPENLAPGAADRGRTPTARLHLQALVAIGWSQSKLADLLGFERSNFSPIVSGDRLLTRGTVDAVEALYEQLSMTLPPERNQRERIAASRARNLAKSRGWLPPLALEDVADVELGEHYIDEAAVERRLAGDKSVRLTKAEKAELRRRWLAAGRSLAELERRTGVNSHRRYEEAS